MKVMVMACLCGGALAVVGCADGPGLATSPSPTSAASGFALSAAPRSGELHVTKECGEYHGLAGEFCTITGSNVKAIEVGSRIVYAQALAFPTLESDITLDTPGPGNNKAFGHCHLDVPTGLGLCTISGGTGKFEHINATAHVTPPASDGNWHWDGTYSFDPQE